MKRLFKNRKGMTMVEVLISIAVLALLSVPIMMTFMNAQVLARKVDKQTEVSAITRTVKQIVTDGIVVTPSAVMTDISGNGIDYNGGGTDTYLQFVNEAKDATVLKVVDDLRIMENGNRNDKYKFSISSCKDFHDSTNFDDVYNVLITIKEIGSDKKVEELMVAVRLDDL